MYSLKEYRNELLSLPSLYAIQDAPQNRKELHKIAYIALRDIEKSNFTAVLKNEESWEVVTLKERVRKLQQGLDKWSSLLELKNIKVKVRALKEYEIIQSLDEHGLPDGYYEAWDGTYWCDRIVLMEVTKWKLKEALIELEDAGVPSSAINLKQINDFEYQILCLFSTPLPWYVHSKFQKYLDKKRICPYFGIWLSKKTASGTIVQSGFVGKSTSLEPSERMFEIAGLKRSFGQLQGGVSF